MEKLITIIKEYFRQIEQNQMMILITASAAFVFLFILLLIKFKKIPLFEAISFMISFGLVAFESLSRARGYTFKGHIGEIEFSLKAISTFIYAVLFIILFFVFLGRLSLDSGYKKGDRKTCVYISKKNVEYTSCFYDCISFLGKKKKKWKNMVREVSLDGNRIEIDDLDEELSEIYDREIVLTLKFINDKELCLVLTRKTDKKGRIYFIKKSVDIIDSYKKEEAQVTIKNESGLPLDKYLSTLNEPIGYFDSSIDKYRLTKKMQERLNLDEAEISYEDLRSYVYGEDYVTYDALKKQKDGSYKYRYRLKTCYGIEWYEEIRAYENDELISTFHKTKFDDVETVIFPKEELMRTLEKRINSKEQFGLVFIYLEKWQSLVRKIGKEAANIIVNNYFGTIQKTLLKDEDSIYYISNSEYCILVSDVSEYNGLLNNVKLDNSDLLKGTVYFEKNKYVISNYLGFVFSEDVPEKNAVEYLEAGLLVLYLANESEENAKYKVYSVDNISDDGIDFESYKVDLDNSFLKEL